MISPFTPPDKQELMLRYSELLPNYRRLIEEVLFTLKRAATREGIKVHTWKSRVKKFTSFYDKILRKKIRGSPFEEIKDIAGVCLVCLYFSDLRKLQSIICQEFDVAESSIKTTSSVVDQFGYTSDHYIVRIPARFQGPRYDDIKGLMCEAQSEPS